MLINARQTSPAARISKRTQQLRVFDFITTIIVKPVVLRVVDQWIDRRTSCVSVYGFILVVNFDSREALIYLINGRAGAIN